MAIKQVCSQQLRGDIVCLVEFCDKTSGSKYICVEDHIRSSRISPQGSRKDAHACTRRESEKTSFYSS